MDLEGKIKVSELKPHPKNNFYFDDMEGDSWDSLLQSISTSGITNAITITDQKVIISGHQRVRACKVLGIPEISYKMMHYDDEEKEIKDLIESNLRQRVVGNANPIKLGRCFQFLNNWYGFESGNNQHSLSKHFTSSESNSPQTQSELAESYDITRQTMNNYMRLASAIPELDDLVQTGIVTKTTALAIMKELKPDEQEELIASMDTTQRITKKQAQQYIDEIQQKKTSLSSASKEIEKLRRQLQDNASEQARLRKRITELIQENVRTEVVTREIDRPETLHELEKLREQVREMEKQNADLGNRLIENAGLLSSAMGTSTNYQLVSHCSEITLKMLDFIKEMAKYDYMAESFNEIPVAFRAEYRKCITSVKRWADRILDVINQEENIIDIVEVEEGS